jgi:cephalosporin hydroxylase
MSAGGREIRAGAGSTAFLQASAAGAADALPGCKEAAVPPEQRPYVHDFSIGASAGAGSFNIVPGKNDWGIPMANSTLQINGKELSFDDILYGYDLIFENLGLFSFTSWFGVSTQQDPSDAFQLSSLIWREQPDLLIEIGTNTGGGAIFYATVMREYNAESLVLTIDPKDPSLDWAAAVGKGCPTCKDVRCTKIWHSKNVQFIHGYSSAPEVLAQVERIVPRFRKVMVMHDGSHFYQHVLQDLQNYDRFTTVGSYMVVQDTKMTRMYTPLNGDGYPLTASRHFMSGQGQGRYVVDKQYEYLLYSQHHDGWLRKVRA